jgi:hypothetical protein
MNEERARSARGMSTQHCPPAANAATTSGERAQADGVHGDAGEEGWKSPKRRGIRRKKAEQSFLKKVTFRIDLKIAWCPPRLAGRQRKVRSVELPEIGATPL